MGHQLFKANSPAGAPLRDKKYKVLEQMSTGSEYCTCIHMN